MSKIFRSDRIKLAPKKVKDCIKFIAESLPDGLNIYCGKDEDWPIAAIKDDGQTMVNDQGIRDLIESGAKENGFEAIKRDGDMAFYTLIIKSSTKKSKNHGNN